MDTLPSESGAALLPGPIRLLCRHSLCLQTAIWAGSSPWRSYRKTPLFYAAEWGCPMGCTWPVRDYPQAATQTPSPSTTPTTATAKLSGFPLSVFWLFCFLLSPQGMGWCSPRHWGILQGDPGHQRGGHGHICRVARGICMHGTAATGTSNVVGSGDC